MIMRFCHHTIADIDLDTTDDILGGKIKSQHEKLLVMDFASLRIAYAYPMRRVRKMYVSIITVTFFLLIFGTVTYRHRS